MVRGDALMTLDAEPVPAAFPGLFRSQARGRPEAALACGARRRPRARGDEAKRIAANIRATAKATWPSADMPLLWAVGLWHPSKCQHAAQARLLLELERTTPPAIADQSPAIATEPRRCPCCGRGYLVYIRRLTPKNALGP